MLQQPPSAKSLGSVEDPKAQDEPGNCCNPLMRDPEGIIWPGSDTPRSGLEDPTLF